MWEINEGGNKILNAMKVVPPKDIGSIIYAGRKSNVQLKNNEPSMILLTLVWSNSSLENQVGAT